VSETVIGIKEKSGGSEGRRVSSANKKTTTSQVYDGGMNI